jgi:hypothetical protein
MSRTGSTPVSAEDPGEEAFDYPAARQYLEAHLIRGSVQRMGGQAALANRSFWLACG